MITSKLPILNSEINQKYQLLAKIGSGGMGDVFLGIQRGAVDFSRLVVIKRIHDREVPMEYAEENARMFLNEASVVASLNHPHIVKIFDFCMAGSSFCIVMEYVEGETLRYIFSECDKEQKRIPVGMSCQLIYDACNTLHYAHNSTSNTGVLRRIIHRDIGLHNLMLDSNGYLKIIDFGIAKSSIQADMTSPGLIKGNPSYMAPELFNKSTQDHRLDIYALGLCLYELLTQTRAFQFSKTATVGEVIQAITTRELPPPSQLVPDDLPEGLDEVVMKSIEKDRDKRYQTVDEFARDLKRVAKDIFMTGNELRQWFTENFASRLKERRDFGAKIVEIAKRSDSVSEMSIQSRLPGGFNSLYTITPSGTQKPVPSHSGSVAFERTGIFFSVNKIIAATVVVLIAIAVLLYLIVFRTPPPQEKVTVRDNVVVNCEPPGANVSIDGKELGMIGIDSLAFHVEPNKEHEIVLSKKGYRDFTLPFIGPSEGLKRINATLVKIEETKTEAEVIDTELVESSSTMAFTNEEHAEEVDKDKDAQKRGKHSGWKRSSRFAGKKTKAQPADLDADKEVPAPKTTPPTIEEKMRKIPLPDDDDSGRRHVTVVD